MLIRPSKLGAIGSNTPENKDEEGNTEAVETSFSRGSGKRQIKPSFKLKESSFSLTPTKIENESKSEEIIPSPSPISNKKPIIRESKLVLNQKLLERLRRKPSHQVEFYSAIQRSLQSADKVQPPKLVEGSSINPGNFFISLLGKGKQRILKAKWW